MPSRSAALLVTSFTMAVAALSGCAGDAPVAPGTPSFSTGNPINTASTSRYTLAVIGDTPYGDAKLAELPRLVTLINGDPKVDLVAHVGDIKAGKNSPCTNDYFREVRNLFEGFKDPLVYTPGDNEWTDCHVAGKNNGLYTPTERLQAVRDLFFPVAGQTLGGRKKQILSQSADPSNSAYVENTMWMESRVVFAALNITGSDNDQVSWGSPLPLDAGTAGANDAAGVVLIAQADMWDPAEPTLAGFDALVRQIGALAASFGKPVLLLEGDSHRFEVDHPFSASSPLLGVHPSTPVAENVTRLVVEGSDGRTEYLRLTIDSQGQDTPLFSWERVPLQ
jgi:hypothetical protein